MVPRGFGLALLAALLLSLQSVAADNPKQKGDSKPIVVDVDTLPAGEYSGKLLAVPSTDNALTLEINSSHTEPKDPAKMSKEQIDHQQKVAKAQAKVAAAQVKVNNAKKPADHAKAVAELQKDQASLQQVIATSPFKPGDLKEVIDLRDVDIKLTETADIRKLALPMVFDDEGKPKKYTADELKELKGKKTTLPGYEAKVEDLKVGQTVKVTLVHITPKPAPKETPAADPKKDEAKPEAVKDTTKDTAAATVAAKDTPDKKVPADKPPAEKKMQAKLVVIVEDVPDTTDSTKPKKKKDK